MSFVMANAADAEGIERVAQDKAIRALEPDRLSCYFVVSLTKSRQIDCRGGL